MTDQPRGRSCRPAFLLLSTIAAILIVAAITIYALVVDSPQSPAAHSDALDRLWLDESLPYESRGRFDASGYSVVTQSIAWDPNASLPDIASTWRHFGFKVIENMDRDLASRTFKAEEELELLLLKAQLLNYEGEPVKAYECLAHARRIAQKSPRLAIAHLHNLIYFQGVTALRRGETENCILCRGESSCILPIAPEAIHTKPEGSRLAIQHFSECLRMFSNDLEVKWLLNIAHMTLGEYPHGVDPNHLVTLDQWKQSEFDIGKFRDIGHLVGVNRLNQAGGAVMDDFDNDGLLDIVCSTMDPTGHMVFYKNLGNGTFEDRTKQAGLENMLGGLNLVHADYNNDGFPDIFVVRGAWQWLAMPPSLLRNNGNGTFTDVTKEAGLLNPGNSISASFADFDNDGNLDLYVCCERQSNRLYRNNGNGAFTEMAAQAGVQGTDENCKGCAWIDFDNDGYPDLFINNLAGPAQLYQNNRNGTFTNVTKKLGISGPIDNGFSCWAFDFNNDGYLDIFATCYQFTLEDVVKGLIGQPHARNTSKLLLNRAGKGFQDVTREAGLEMAFGTMGSNFGDFDNDGYLDFYLGTGEPNLAMLIPNRMFKNVAGKRFAEITASSGTGQLQKGHGVACGDWDRDGNVDIFIEMGGAVHGDKYHNVLFQNPGQGNHSLTVKLIGKKSNRSAIGARIEVVTAGHSPQTIHRHVSTGSSFGGNPLQQTIGIGKSKRIDTLKVFWPTSNTTQVFRDVAADQAIEITEFASEYRKLYSFEATSWHR